MVNLGASLYNALPLTQVGGNRLPASDFTLREGDESTQGGNSLRAVASEFRQQAGLSDFSPPPEGQQGFASLGPVLQQFQPKIPPLYEFSGPTSWERLLEEQKRISAAREEAARNFQDLLNSRDEAAAELEDRLQLVKDNSERARFEAEPREELLGEETDDEENNNIAQQVLNSQRSENASAEIDSGEDRPRFRSETAPLPGQGTRIDDPNQPEDAILQAEDQPRSTSEQQEVARLFSTTDNTGNSINFFA